VKLFEKWRLKNSRDGFAPHEQSKDRHNSYLQSNEKTHLSIESQEVINQRGTTVSCLVCGIGIKTEFFRDISFPTPLQLTISIVIQSRRHECRIAPLPRPIPLGEGGFTWRHQVPSPSGGKVRMGGYSSNVSGRVSYQQSQIFIQNPSSQTKLPRLVSVSMRRLRP